MSATVKEQPNPVIARTTCTGVQIRFGVMGSAASATANVGPVCRELGRAIALRGACLLTGACPGMPHEAVLGSKEAGGHTIGISPATTLKEHVEDFGSPYKEYDVLIFTGLGLMGRELINIRSSDIVVIVGGRCGTLGEFAIAYEEGKLIGVLKGTGGVAEAIPQIVESFDKKTGAEVLYDDSPTALVNRLLARYNAPDYECPCLPDECRCPTPI